MPHNRKSRAALMAVGLNVGIRGPPSANQACNFLLFQFNTTRDLNFLHGISDTLRDLKKNISHYAHDIVRPFMSELLYIPQGFGRVEAEATVAEIKQQALSQPSTNTFTDEHVTWQRLLLVKNGLLWQVKYGSLALPLVKDGWDFITTCCAFLNGIGGSLEDEVLNHIAIVAEALQAMHWKAKGVEDEGLEEELRVFREYLCECLRRCKCYSDIIPEMEEIEIR